MSDLLKCTVMAWACVCFSACTDKSNTQRTQADSGPSSPMDAAPSTDLGQPVDGMQPDTRPVADAVLDSATASDASTPSLDIGGPGQDAEPYRGMRMVPVQSPLYFTSAYLALSAADEMYISFLVGRLIPRVDDMGDRAHLQPWLMYQPDNAGDDWMWLLMGFYLPHGTAAQLPDETKRVQAGRTSPWYKKTDGALIAVPNDDIGSVLGQVDQGSVCGGARVAARFKLKLPNGQTIENAVGVAMTVGRSHALDLGWLRGCETVVLP